MFFTEAQEGDATLEEDGEEEVEEGEEEEEEDNSSKKNKKGNNNSSNTEDNSNDNSTAFSPSAHTTRLRAQIRTLCLKRLAGISTKFPEEFATDVCGISQTGNASRESHVLADMLFHIVKGNIKENLTDHNNREVRGR